jgi:RNA recognition motif-containing protein
MADTKVSEIQKTNLVAQWLQFFFFFYCKIQIQIWNFFDFEFFFTVTEDDLDELFKPFGPLTEVHLPLDKLSKMVKGFAFITYVIPENAVQAFTKLDGTSFQGKINIFVVTSVSNPVYTDTGIRDSKYRYRQKFAGICRY